MRDIGSTLVFEEWLEKWARLGLKSLDSIIWPLVLYAIFCLWERRDHLISGNAPAVKCLAKLK
ncbi:hypothetical protein FRX31_026318 [Thalictrum thalictroides]|uniref:Uncharacterized protein n=1 Tax=Thalictrum thalictroides TaxID=46969 RepID=A0A7J6VG73_THATH|nr:hypothetical protein FRX31_026318 [Thalictrum thalictroides]